MPFDNDCSHIWLRDSSTCRYANSSLTYSRGEESDSRILSDPSGKLSDFIGSDGNSLEIGGILGIGFRQEVVGCRKMPE
ncbi:unnamed protein product [Rotaria socialis]